MIDPQNLQSELDRKVATMQRVIDVLREERDGVDTICFNIIVKWAYLHPVLWQPCLKSLPDEIISALQSYSTEHLERKGFRNKQFLAFAATPTDDELENELSRCQPLFEEFYKEIKKSASR